MKAPVLLLGAESSIGLAVMRELGRHGVPVIAVGRKPNAIGRYSRYCADFRVRGQGPIDQWLPAMIAETEARALMAYSETDLVQLGQMPARILDCEILTPRADKLAQVLDKAKTIDRAKACGIEVPVDHEGIPDRWPVVLKWADPPAVQGRLAAAGIPWLKTEFCRNADELETALSRYRPIGLRPLVQSYAPGRGIAHMMHRHAGRTTLYFQHEQLNEWPPEGGVASLCRAVAESAFSEQRVKSEALLDALGWEGPAMVEYRYDSATGSCVFMEVNGRFWGSQPLASAARAEFGWELYRRRVLGDTTPASAYRPHVKARMFMPEVKRLLRLFFQRRKILDPCFRPTPWRDLGGLIMGYFDPHMHHYIYSWRDPMPFVMDLTDIGRRGGAKLARLAFGRMRRASRLDLAGPAA